MKYKPTAINPEDAQFLASRRFQVIEIARIFRVPPHKIMELSDAHYNNIENSNLDYARRGLIVLG